MNNYFYELEMGYPILYESIYFYPISLDEIYHTFGMDNFNNLIIPFCITPDYAEQELGIQTTNDKLVEDVILNDEFLLKSVCLVISVFCKCENITLSDKTLHLYDKNENIIFNITSQNFNDISDIILKINSKTKIKVEKPPANMSERQRDIWQKLQAGRKRDAKKNELHLYDVINTCEFGGKFYISKDEIKKWTLWQLMQCYQAIINVRDYEDSLAIGIASYDLKAVTNNNHLIKRLMIRE